MPSPTLFPLDREPLQPVPDRREPLLWLRRIVILSALDSSTVIRNIEFRRGLNIIQTRQMETQGGPVAGHSVGKTLLMRLIRYTLGEPHFGTEETQQNIAVEWETAYVVGHWSVAGADWIVVRPMRTADASESFAACGDGWQQVVDSPRHDHTYRDFCLAVREAMLADLPTFTLPRGREAKWLDILAWLSRDYQCGYRKANEWRHEDANPGPNLDRDDNSLIMQWVMGMMSPDEIELRLKHRELLNQRADHKRAAERDQKKRETLWPSLKVRLKLADNAEVVDEQKTIDSVAPVEVVNDKIGSLRRLKSDLLAEAQVTGLEQDRDAVQDKLNDTEAEIRSCGNTIQFITKQVAEYERDPLRWYAKCQAKPTCWMREMARETASDPAKDEHLADLREQLDEQRREQAHAKSKKAALQKEFDGASQRLKAEQKRLAEELSKIDQNIGRWKGSEGDARTFQDVTKAVTQSNAALVKADRDIDSSLKRQEAVRGKHSTRVTRLSDVYQQILQQIFGDDVVGRIQIDGNGLQPMPDKKLAPAGAALSVMTTVLAFDIACVAASVTGIGHHPRFLLHDSPREGDMEGPLFRRLFNVVHDLEGTFPAEDQVSFQYIVTTTTAPPKELSNEEGPYVRETLDARTDDGLLLRKRF